jgi:predicted AAA+ superfamily ATPase
MAPRQRIYDAVLGEHLKRYRQMILRGPAAVAAALGLERLRAERPVAVFDELHKFSRWKSFLKGFFDTYAEAVRVLVTGSSRLDVYRRGGDSLMGRYFLYRMHPFTVAELANQDLPDSERIVRLPRAIDAADFDALWEHGGYPEPFVRREAAFTRRWRGLRQKLLLREDIRDLTRVHELDQLAALVELLVARSSDQIVYSNLAQDVQVSVDTAKRWVDTLSGFHLGFLLRPWFKSVTRSLRKEPKWFLRDWSGVADAGKRAETFVACHLLKAVEGWTDLGLGDFHLGYIRDKAGQEVDFLVARDGRPWMLVEVKVAETRLSGALARYQEQTGAAYAFQVVLEADYVEADCFAARSGPMVVPARTFLSQLL